MFFDKKKESLPSFAHRQSIEQKIDEVVEVLKDTVYEYDTGIALSKRAAVEIPLFQSVASSGYYSTGIVANKEEHQVIRKNIGFAYFTQPRAPKCDYIVKDEAGVDTYFKKQADVQVARNGSPLKVKKVRAKAKTK